MLKIHSQTSCGCLQKTMMDLQKEIIQSQITFKSIQNLLKPIPPDLKIICEDMQEYSSHKILFGLLNPTLATLFLEEDFINENVTLFLPVDSELFKNDTLDEFSSILKNKLEEVVSNVHVPFVTDIAVPTTTTIAKIETKDAQENFMVAELDNEIGYYEEGEIDPSPVQIKIRKKKKRIKSEYTDKPKTQNRCMKCQLILRKDTDMEVHLIACKQRNEKPDESKSKDSRDYNIICPLCEKSVRRRLFESMHYYRCSNWTVPGSELRKARYEKEKKWGRMNKNEDEVACEECGKILRNEHTLKNHIQHVHNLDKIFFQCDKCEFKTPNKATLKGHIQNVHFVAFQTCHICGKKVKGHKDQSRLRRHIKRYHTEQERIKCQLCGKEMRKDHLRKHTQAIHEERKHACHLCSYKAQSAFNLKLHISKSHLGVKELPKSTCQYCQHVTTNLPYHLKRYHPDHV